MVARPLIERLAGEVQSKIRTICLLSLSGWLAGTPQTDAVLRTGGPKETKRSDLLSGCFRIEKRPLCLLIRTGIPRASAPCAHCASLSSAPILRKLSCPVPVPASPLFLLLLFRLLSKINSKKVVQKVRA